ncbi:MAG: glycosyltransferase [Selenomonadaceae bacterium]
MSDTGNGAPKISAYAIVKNERANIEAWIASAKKFADEIVVVDTGSTDGTDDIAAKLVARVERFSWRDDFAAARNFAIEHVHGDWIVGLDADESIDDESAQKIKETIQEYDKKRKKLGMVFRWVNLDRDNNMSIKNVGNVMRAYRRMRTLRFSGAVHEMLMAGGRPLDEAEIAFVPEVTVYHTGYSSRLIKKKLRRDLDIILAEQRQHGEKPTDAFYLADCYYGLDDYEHTIAAAKRAIRSGYTMIGRENRPYALILQSLVALHRPMSEIDDALDMALNACPGVGDFYVLAGLGAYEAGEYERAETYMRHSMALYEKAETNHNIVDERHALLPTACLYAARVARMRMDDATALDDVTRGLRLAPQMRMLLEIAAEILAPLETADAIAFLNAIYKMPQDSAFLAEALSATPLKEAAMYYARHAGMSVSPFDAFIMAGKNKAAAAMTMELVDGLSSVGAASGNMCGAHDSVNDFGTLAPSHFKASSGALASDDVTERALRLSEKIKRMRREIHHE